MIWFYVASAIFGCAFLIPMMLGGLDSEIGDGVGGDIGDGADVGGLDLDVEADLDIDVAGDIDVAEAIDVGQTGSVADGAETAGPETADLGSSNPLGAIFASLVSFRTVVFFAAFFGMSGVVFDLVGYSAVVTLPTAILIGVIAAVANSLLFGLVRSSQPNSQISDRTFEGRPARVVLPMDATTRGRIRIDLTGQPQYLVAKPMEGSEQEFDVGAPVVVVKVENGTAHVASLAELDAGEES